MDTPELRFNPPVPIIRMFDVGQTKDFYLNFLGFTLDWEHTFDENFPLYMQISRSGCVIHLSEHYGDCSPGAALRIETDNVADLHSRLLSQQYKYARPGLENTPWGTKEIQLTDPSGNRIIFYQPSPPA
ncbi:VOC family protein [Paenibacillus doosanensis]|uniref:Bleomycin resistance protein n=1 Tax=Paenibacillus konkukensis TaxID=2020716 RepID=A0ABY4RRX7_9BACL|nr:MULTISPECIES: glyoxalase superfamily protein [Paenibacillus]MCS7461260.1 VOC family protein [Paenibacillus doosanensis]UQZ85299.1 Glyoxalase-like domain protein [Paenibacillus konkukensis]